MSLSFLPGRKLFERRFRGATQHFPGGGETRAVAGTIPRFFRFVPAHDATQVRANRRAERHLPVRIAVSGYFFPFQPQDLAFVADLMRCGWPNAVAVVALAAMPILALLQ